MTSERETLLPNQHVWESTAPGVGRVDQGVGNFDEGRPLRRDVWTILRYRASIPHRSCLQRTSYTVEVCVLILILLNVLLAMRESALIAHSPESYVHAEWYDTFLYFSTAIFTVEYLLRLWSCVEDARFENPIIGRITWMLRPMSAIDLAVLVPFYLEIFFEHEVTSAVRGVVTIRGLRLLRIMSFLRLERSYNALKNLRELFAQKKEELWVVSYLTGVIVITGSTTIFFLENPAQPEVFSSLGVCMWWSIETITSLGYGDIVPITGAGRFFSSILALWGIILFTIPGAILSSGYVEVMLQEQAQTSQARFQEEFRRTLSRELLVANSNGFRHGVLDLNGENTLGSVSPGEPGLTAQKELSVLQKQVGVLIDFQREMQLQLLAQKHKLEAIHSLLQHSPRNSRPMEMPPFSAIVPPKL